MPTTSMNGLIRTSIALRPDQYEALRQLALEKSNSTGGKPDSGEILRGIIDLFMEQRAAKPKKRKK